MNNKLSIEQVVKLARCTAKNLGIILPDESMILRKLAMQNPKPIVIKSKNYTLWIDRHYIAYSDSYEDDINYVYVTEQHIHEEFVSFIDAGNAAVFPGEIEEQFRFAYENMKQYEQKYWISKKKRANCQLE